MMIEEIAVVPDAYGTRVRVVILDSDYTDPLNLKGYRVLISTHRPTDDGVQYLKDDGTWGETSEGVALPDDAGLRLRPELTQAEKMQAIHVWLGNVSLSAVVGATIRECLDSVIQKARKGNTP